MPIEKHKNRRKLIIKKKGKSNIGYRLLEFRTISKGVSMFIYHCLYTMFIYHIYKCINWVINGVL